MLSDKDKKHQAIISAMTARGQQFELVDTNVSGVTLKTFKNAPPTMASFFEMCRAHGDLEFIVYQGERYSFADTYARAASLAATLQKTYCVQKGDRVVIAMRNYPEWMFAFMGIIMAGGVAVPVNAWWRTQELGYAVEDCGAAVVICDAARAEYLSKLPYDKQPAMLVARPGELAITAKMRVLDDGILAAGRAPEAVNTQPDDDATILYTSGSTGYPKGAVSTHRGLITTLMNYAVYGLSVAQLEGQSVDASSGKQAVCLLAVPLFHITGLVPVALICILIGRKLIFLHRWDASDALETMQREKVTYFVGVPTMSLELMQHPQVSDYDLGALEDVIAGGAPRPAEHVAKLKRTFPNARPGIGYGLTETNAAGTVNSREPYLEKPGSAGRIMSPATELKIAHDDGVSLQTGDVAEIWIRSAGNTRGYWNRPNDTAEAFPGDGWFKTGDLGYLDEDGFLFIVDRKKEIIIRGGENIACLEVEAEIFHHEDVAEASVFGLPDERLGEIVSAAVFLKAGAALTKDMLMAHLTDHLAAYKVPAHIVLSPEPLPKLATGKIDKRTLKAALTKQLGL